MAFVDQPVRQTRQWCFRKADTTVIALDVARTCYEPATGNNLAQLCECFLIVLGIDTALGEVNQIR